MNLFLSRLTLGLALILGNASPVRTEDQVPEYLLKATVIESLSHYVVWPSQEDNGKVLLTVVGQSPFEGHLEPVFNGAKIAGKAKPLCYAKKPALACDSRILFICRSEASVLPQILDNVKGRPVLTVSDTPGFAQKGVMVNLVARNRRVFLEINYKAVLDAKLRISSHVLKLAEIVDGSR